MKEVGHNQIYIDGYVLYYEEKVSSIVSCKVGFIFVKGKSVPLHAMEAHGGEARYSSILTSALDGGE
jgi:hypothetical protein